MRLGEREGLVRAGTVLLAGQEALHEAGRNSLGAQQDRHGAGEVLAVAVPVAGEAFDDIARAAEGSDVLVIGEGRRAKIRLRRPGEVEWRVGPAARLDLLHEFRGVRPD